MTEADTTAIVRVAMNRPRIKARTLGEIIVAYSPRSRLGGDSTLTVPMTPFDMAELLSKGKVSVHISLNRVDDQERGRAAKQLFESLDGSGWAQDSVKDTLGDLLKRGDNDG